MDVLARGWPVGVLLLVAFAGPILLLDFADFAATFHDDAYYYLVVARSVAEGHGFTFDGEHDTNGFQPLWLFLLTPLLIFVRGEQAPLYVVAAVESALLVLAGVLLFRNLRRLVGPVPGAVAGLWLAVTPGALHIFRNGMESSALALALVLTWHEWLRLETESPRAWVRWARLGACAAVCALLRLEMALLLPVMLVLRPLGLSRSLASGAALVAPSSLALGGYLLWNRLHFGIWLPISGLVKLEWFRDVSWWRRALGLLDLPWLGHRLLLPGPLEYSPTHRIVAYLAFVLLCVVLAWRFRGRVLRALRRSGASLLLLAAGLAFLAVKATIYRETPWQRAPVLVASAVAAAALVSLLGRRLQRIVLLVAALAALVRLPHRLHTASVPHRRHHLLLAARWLDRHTPPDARVGSTNAGILGWFSWRTVVNLDGLVNDVDYLRRVVRGRAGAEYLIEQRIGWLADLACSPAADVARPLAIIHAEELAGRYELAATRALPRAPEPCSRFAVWRWAGAPRAPPR